MKTARVIIAMILGKICSIFGYTLGSLMLLALLIKIFDGGSSATPIGTDILGFSFSFALTGLMIFGGIRIKRRVKRFKNYVHLISYRNITSLQNIAASNNQSIDFVTNDIQKMIDKGYFKNAVIDTYLGEVIVGKIPTVPAAPMNTIATPVEGKTFKCQSCGALNTLSNCKSTKCEYCGSPIN